MNHLFYNNEIFIIVNYVIGIVRETELIRFSLPVEIRI